MDIKSIIREKLNQENISEEQKNIIEKAVEIGLEALEKKD